MKTDLQTLFLAMLATSAIGFLTVGFANGIALAVAQ